MLCSRPFSPSFLERSHEVPIIEVWIIALHNILKQKRGPSFYGPSARIYNSVHRMITQRCPAKQQDIVSWNPLNKIVTALNTCLFQIARALHFLLLAKCCSSNEITSACTQGNPNIDKLQKSSFQILCGAFQVNCSDCD